MFKIGDRVRTREDVKHLLLKGPFSGTVMKTDGVEVFVLRDDGIRSTVRADGTWRTNRSFVEMMNEDNVLEARSEGVKEETTHVAGLDPETIDWNAHKEFGRGM